MCGRMQQPADAETLARLFDAQWEEVAEAERWQPNLDLRPTDPAPALFPAAKGHPIRLAHFGLVAPWMRHRRESSRLINARSETAAEKPAFRDAMRKRRCAVPVGGWYEWGTPAGAPSRSAWLHTSPDAPQLLLAGLWSPPQPALGVHLPSFSLLTIAASGVAAEVHHRMPVLLDERTRAGWLDGVLQPAEAHSLALARIPLQRRELDPRHAQGGPPPAPQLALALSDTQDPGGRDGQDD